MKRIIVIGCPGSGKSTFSRTLQEKTQLPLIHLDMLYWNADGTCVQKEVFLERLNQAVRQDAWIIDGNYGSTLELRMKACDTIIFLDYPLDVCLDGIQARRGQARSDIPWIEPTDNMDESFVEFVKDYRQTSRPGVMQMLQKYEDKNIIILKSRDEGNVFLKGLG